MWRRLDHVAIAVRDLDAAAARMGRLLGLRPSWRGARPSDGTANVLFRLENTTLELLAPRGEGPLGARVAARLAAVGEGLVALGLATDDLAACAAVLTERGLEPEPARDGLGRDEESGAFRAWRSVTLPTARTRGVPLSAVEHRGPADVLPPASPAGPPEAAVHALDHVVIQSADADAARMLYGECLGLRLALDRSFPDWGVRLLFFRVGGLTLELAARLGGPPDPAAPDRLWGLSYRVRDAAAARERIAAEGFDVSPVRPGRKPGTRVFTVRGAPCGVETLVLEPPADSPRGSGA